MKDNYFKQLAIRESFKSSYKFSLGAILVKQGKIIGSGHNNVCYTGGSRPFLNGQHAEVNAINDSNTIDRINSTIYIARYRKSNSLGCAKPCTSCEIIMRKLGIKYVWYSDYGNIWKRIKL